ncbi:MAG: hypothetical protein ACE10E_07005, partial [Acidiferrobacterales bacterium]
ELNNGKALTREECPGLPVFILTLRRLCAVALSVSFQGFLCDLCGELVQFPHSQNTEKVRL